MDSSKLFESLKKIIKAPINETFLLISGGLTAFFLIFIFNSGFGIYSTYGLSNDLIKNMARINMARNAQVALHEQILAWDKILIYGYNYSDFQKSYHEFSLKGEIVQNTLFNLKLQSSGEIDLIADIDRLIVMHKNITSEFTAHIVHLDEENFRNFNEKITLTKGKENELIDAITDIAQKIETESERESVWIRDRSIIFLLISSVFLITILIFYGRRIGARLIENHNFLDTSLSVSEGKYSHIVEGTNEVIFTLDEEWRFKSVNNAARTDLLIDPKDAASYNFTDFIYDEIGDNITLRQVVLSRLEEAKRELAPIRFDTLLKTPNLIEPIEFKVNIEFIEIEGYIEIIGKAVKKADDRFSEFFISEKSEYSIGNFLFTADDISHRITGNLQKYLDKSDINLIRLGLREILINSIEHGNLGITFKEKSLAIIEDTYFDLLNERQKHPDYKERKVQIEYFITPSKAVYKITDQGAGFDHKNTIPGKLKEVNDNLLPHGRGIHMAKKIFDEIRYNDKGNQVLLVKQFDLN